LDHPDKDKDTKQIQEMLKSEKETFVKHDLNKDGKLDKGEVQRMVIPDSQQSADEEADHLIKETDTDKNGKLSKNEILEKYQTWVGSAATDFGKKVGVHDEEEEEHDYHDPEEL